MKRSRPKQHVRKLKRGKRIIVNKGIKRKRSSVEQKIINRMFSRYEEKRKENNILKREIDRHRGLRNNSVTFADKLRHEEHIEDRKRRMITNNETMIEMDKAYKAWKSGR